LFEYEQYYYDGYKIPKLNENHIIDDNDEKYYYLGHKKPSSDIKYIICNNIYYYKPSEPDELWISSYNCLNKLSSFNLIAYLNFDHCGMKNITVLPKRLIELHCEGNRFTKLPRLPNRLKILNCSKNNIKELPELPSTLCILNCGNNALLKYIPKLPKLLKTLNFMFTKVDKFPDNILDLLSDKDFIGCNHYGTPLSRDMEKYNYSSDCAYNCGNHRSERGMGCLFYTNITPCKKSMIRNYITYNISVKKIENWFLDCKYNPKYKYCRDKLNKEFTELYNE